MHAGSELRYDRTEPAHHRALVRRHDIEARAEVASEQSNKNDQNQTEPATPEQARKAGTRRQVASGSVRPGSPLVAGTLLYSCECYRTPSSGFFDRRSATPLRAGAEGEDSPGAGSKRSIRSTSASAGRNRVVLSSRNLS